MTNQKILYVWLEGQITAPPKIHVKAEQEMPLLEFRDKYVDTSQPHLIMRVYSAKDDQEQDYKIVLQITDEAPPVEQVHRTDQTLGGTSLTLIKGIGRKTAALFHRQTRVDSLESLLREGATLEGRSRLARETGKARHLISRWVQLADLMRVDGVGGDYSALLWQAGVTSIPELGRQETENLEKLLDSTNQRRRLVNRLPSSEQIKDWITQAQKLAPVVEG
jgi:predicted flap endonuclease-1-like 5' DNA nuclease